jgi:hypothetical protein
MRKTQYRSRRRADGAGSGGTDRSGPAVLSPELIWVVRIGVIAAALFVSGGFFAVAHVRALRGLLYLGAFLVAATTLTAGIGLLRMP